MFAITPRLLLRPGFPEDAPALAAAIADEAIARNLYEMSKLQVPIIATVIGEGGSGGALALGVADRVLMMENAVY